MPIMATLGSYAAQATATRIGIRYTAACAMTLIAVGSLFFARVSAFGTYAYDIFPGLLIFGPGLGGGAVAASIASLRGVKETESGVASGVNNAAFPVGAPSAWRSRRRSRWHTATVRAPLNR
jgi:hypothetical protein